MPTDHVWVCVLSHLSFCGMIFDLFSIHFIVNNFFKKYIFIVPILGQIYGGSGTLSLLFHPLYLFPSFPDS